MLNISDDQYLPIPVTNVLFYLKKIKKSNEYILTSSWSNLIHLFYFILFKFTLFYFNNVGIKDPY